MNDRGKRWGKTESDWNKAHGRIPKTSGKRLDSRPPLQKYGTNRFGKCVVSVCRYFSIRVFTTQSLAHPLAQNPGSAAAKDSVLLRYRRLFASCGAVKRCFWAIMVAADVGAFVLTMQACSSPLPLCLVLSPCLCPSLSLCQANKEGQFAAVFPAHDRTEPRGFHCLGTVKLVYAAVGCTAPTPPHPSPFHPPPK